jgi:GNAT superfamily N-acetyltransferase
MEKNKQNSTNKPWQLRSMQSGEETKVNELIARVFNQYIAPNFSAEGCAEFMKYIHPNDIRRRSQLNHFVILAISEEEILGVTEIRDYDHISLLFVDGGHQGKGIGRALLDQALEISKKNKPDLEEISVNASPNSILIYQHMGFKPTSSEQIKNGVRYTPMVLELKASSS